ncbi:MAG TPA: autotransporter-associated beta strand repeat-containing protein, partial [bacterium]|nr:autotransporter-associated beta strand repeat-containing protein [bacterium]
NGVFNMSGGSLTKTGNNGNHLLIGAGHDGVLNQTGGTVTSVLSETRIADGPTGTWNLNGGSAVLSVLHIAQNSGNVGTLNLNGGSLTATEVTMGNAGGKGTLNFNGGTLIAGSGANANFLHDLATNNVLAGGAIIDSGANTISIPQPLLDGGGAGGLIKAGSGTLYLNGANTYTGPTVVTNGTLGGTGIIAGSVIVASGASLAPGASIGTLTVNGSVSLTATSTNVMEVNKTTGTNDVLSVGGTLTLGGTLVLKNLGGALAVNDTFHLFAPGSFAASTFSAVQSITPGQVVTWDISNAAVNGTVKVASVVNVPVALMPVVSGGNLTLSWPADQTGWTLQMQTNSLAVGLGTNWVNVAGSTTTNQVTLPIIPAPLSGFFRLVF